MKHIFMGQINKTTYRFESNLPFVCCFGNQYTATIVELEYGDSKNTIKNSYGIIRNVEIIDHKAIKETTDIEERLHINDVVKIDENEYKVCNIVQEMNGDVVCYIRYEIKNTEDMGNQKKKLIMNLMNIK